ncbi:hypothetical protein BJ546DRAFT_519112 [Cryomyces antarcticus]
MVNVRKCSSVLLLALKLVGSFTVDVLGVGLLFVVGRVEGDELQGFWLQVATNTRDSRRPRHLASYDTNRARSDLLQVVCGGSIVHSRMTDGLSTMQMEQHLLLAGPSSTSLSVRLLVLRGWVIRFLPQCLAARRKHQ